MGGCPRIGGDIRKFVFWSRRGTGRKALHPAGVSDSLSRFLILWSELYQKTWDGPRGTLKEQSDWTVEASLAIVPWRQVINVPVKGTLWALRFGNPIPIGRARHSSRGVKGCPGEINTKMAMPSLALPPCPLIDLASHHKNVPTPRYQSSQ